MKGLVTCVAIMLAAINFVAIKCNLKEVKLNTSYTDNKLNKNRYKIGMRELCLNNFRNSDRAKELSVIPEF